MDDFRHGREAGRLQMECSNRRLEGAEVPRMPKIRVYPIKSNLAGLGLLSVADDGTTEVDAA